MSDWNHRQLGDLLDEVHGLELSDPSTVEHPSTVELEAYLEEELSPFMQASVDHHLQSCERCVTYLSEAYEREESRPSSRPLPFVQRARSAVSPWLAAAAMWVLAIPSGAWLSSYFLAEPVIVQTRIDGGPTRSAADLGAVSGAQGFDSAKDATYVLTQSQMDQWAQSIKTAVVDELGEARADTADRSGARLAMLSPEDRLGLIQPYLDEFIELASDRLVQIAHPQLEDEIRKVFHQMSRGSEGTRSVSTAEDSVSGTSGPQDFMAD